MEVKDFVKNILKDITEAIQESKNTNYSFELVDSRDGGISFDLGVVLKEQADGKVSTEIFSIMGAKAEGHLSKENVNRVQFKVMAFKQNIPEDT